MDSGEHQRGVSLRNAIIATLVGVSITGLIQIGGMIWYMSWRDATTDSRLSSIERQITSLNDEKQKTDTFDTRLSTVEGRQVAFAQDVGRLDQARENTDKHLVHVDDQLDEVGRNVATILDIVQRWEQNSLGGSGVGISQQPNFPPPAHR